MDNFLSQIITTKTQEVLAAAAKEPLADIRAKAQDRPPARDFIGAIQSKHQNRQIAVIAEVKKASPSKGIIREDFHPVSIAQAYERGGAACLSVLTDEKYFQGDALYLYQARRATKLPVLRKDFMIDPYQIYQARTWDADAVLLIAAILEREQLLEMESIAHELGMAVLLELHHESELEKCRGMKTPLWGINNRDLTTFKVNLKTSLRMMSKPELQGKTVVTESGITSVDDIRMMRNQGIHTFLIGETLMRADNIEAELSNLLHV
ncbi:indole-3-glycerol phosphate synthase TrpC [Stenoxybacter acetivorans]|uniref:indole-3-glycerol phosphate synthase TrpC n=1 Tax=Stenoxybacter acetivorans TaxID=422441 RepID=UPI000566755C|nr:indole-3-glycerol phosphate synthase TrpC [Stenoxybacter acetivorans]